MADNTANDDACEKLWSIYVGEAERYDRRLVESWMSDMDAMLIFVRVRRRISYSEAYHNDSLVSTLPS